MDNKEEVKGKIKQAIGQAASAAEMTAKGVRKECKEGYVAAKRKVGKAIEEIGQKIKN